MRVKSIIIFFITAIFSSAFAVEEPSLFIGKQEAKAIKTSLRSYPILYKSFHKTKTEIDNALTQPIEVPPPGEAGGYEHEKHKQNYRDMRNAGLMFRILEDEKYALFVREMLSRYAEVYPKLGPHPLSHNQRPGKLFHQTLNEAVWLVYVSQAYDCVYEWLSEDDKQNFEKSIFRPMLSWFAVKNESQLNRIHNHGTWAVAAVGMMAYRLNDKDLVEKCLYGTKKDGNGGFLNQLDLLFSPDGYYMEGPYYIRYALRPFFLFAEAIERFQPEIKIYEYRNQILKKAFYATAQTIFPNGIFPPINDASKTMDITAPGPLIAHNIVYHRYGGEQNLLAISRIQDEVILNAAGLSVAKDYSDLDESPELNWGSVELTDGHDGKEGGLGILRMGKGMDETMLLMKYGVHGKGHGHFDKLHFILFEQGREVIPDYGFSRWINIEPKFGGRYLPENDSYAMQTIAHNTIVVDQISQNRARRRDADKMSGQRHFFSAKKEKVQVMSARADDYYPGVKMQRTMFLIRDDKLRYPVIVDLFRITSDKEHTFDYPIHYRGQLITTTFDFNTHSELLKPIGANYGYEHIWEEGSGVVQDAISITWLDGNRYYSFTSSGDEDSRVLFGRTGANDPAFNLRSEPLFLIRRQAKDHLFASVIEPHGYFNEAKEQSENARPLITKIEVIGHDNEGSVVEVSGQEGLKWQIMVNNGIASEYKQKSIVFQGKKFEWTGNYKIEIN